MVDRRILREFMQGYFACALWSSNDESTEDGGSPLDESYSVDDIDAKCEAGATNECKDFIEANWADLQEYVERRRIECLANGWNVWGSAAHDFWLSRNGHGAGFFDRGLGALGDRLQAAAKVYGEQYLYVGDNDTLYIGGFENYEAPAGEAAA